MSVVTILCHGTENSRDTATSSGNKLVISKIAELLQGVEEKEWLLLEGAGTKALRDQGVTSNNKAGIVKGEGVQANVDRAVWFLTQKNTKSGLANPTKVNLVGHSRGSITCYKIAYALRKYPDIAVNIFAIDPVPGNNGSINKEMHDHIQIGDNVGDSFLMLAESEHRMNFRPYVDALYANNQPRHRFDTIPGTHGGINELNGREREAAAIVLSRAVRFLQMQGSVFNDEAMHGVILSDADFLTLYASMMMRIKEYKKGSSVNLFRIRTKDDLKTIGLNFVATSGQVDKHRIANVAGNKATWGGAEPSRFIDKVKAKIPDLRKPATEGRSAHHGLNLSEAVARMNRSEEDKRENKKGDKAHAARPNRFFANQQHEELFAQAHADIFPILKLVERKAEEADLARLKRLTEALGDSTEKNYLLAYLQARKK